MAQATCGTTQGMSVKVIYSTEAFLHKHGDKPGTQRERCFPSLDEAKAAVFP
jgi:hypothetical protein